MEGPNDTRFRLETRWNQSFHTTAFARQPLRDAVFRGDGIDIGSGSDRLVLYREFFPLIEKLMHWDAEQGDAQILATVEDQTFDFVYSSQCLEHLVDPFVGLRNWFRVLKKGGHLIVTIPDEDLYEQGQFPSIFNSGHKWTFTIYKTSSWCERSVNVLDLLTSLEGSLKVRKVELLDAGFLTKFQVATSQASNLNELPSAERFDQTKTHVSESSIEFIVQKL